MKIALKLGLAWPDIKDLYDVSFDGTRIGRVWFACDRSPAQQPWEWLVSLPMALPDSTKGAAATLNDALNAFATAWAQVLSTTQPARLQRALELAQVVDQKDQSATSVRASQQNSLEHTLDLAALGADVVRDVKAAEQPERSGPTAAAATTAAGMAPETPAVTTAPPAATQAATAGHQRPPPLPQPAADLQKPPRKVGRRINISPAKSQGPVLAINTRPAVSKPPPARSATPATTTSGPIRPALHPVVHAVPPTPPAAPQNARGAPAQGPGQLPPGGPARSNSRVIGDIEKLLAGRPSSPGA
jgi:hypothetical protein